MLEHEDARPRRLAVDATGTVWYSDYARGALGAFDSEKKSSREWPCPQKGAAPYGIALGADGRVWYDESGADTMVGFDPASHANVAVKIPTSGSVVRNIAADPKRRCLWLALSGVGKLAKLDLA